VRAAVLAYVAVSEDVTRNELIGTFWPERTEARARHALSQVLHKLRRALGAGWLETEGELIRLAPAVRVDAHEFEQAVQFHRANALRIYHGPFLDRWSLHCAHGFELWLDSRRRRFARLHAHACRAFAREKQSAGDLEGALGAVQCWRDSAPLDEAAALAFAELLLRCGKRSEAVREQRDFLNRLSAEEIKPSRELLQEFERLLQAPADEADFNIKVRPTFRPVRDVAAAPRSPAARERVFVAPFENRTGEARLDAFGRLAADWITEGLDRAALGKIVPLLDDPRVNAGAGDPNAEGHTLTHTCELAWSAGAGTLVTGSYYRIGDALELRAQLVDLEANELQGLIDPVRGSPDGEMAALSLVRDRVLGLVAAVLDTAWANVPTGPELGLPPPTYAAYRAYSIGLEFFVRK
jgi:DNA-binding SARP family transcriptional activator